uniref:Uncharacterized protein n=1 Tax=Avena sativa TaxID=4498 RepID=A0ACD5TLD4_AVESA
MSTCASSSAIVVGTVSGYHLLKIDSYSRIRDLIPLRTCTTLHRCVLESRSLVFKAEFFGAMTKEGTTTKGAVHVEGVEPQAFMAFLHFVYTDTLPDIRDEEETWMLHHLLVLADRYDMDRLKLICQGKLRNRIDVSSAATTLALAEQHHYHGLKDACLDFLELPGNLKAVVASDGFDHLATSCPDVLREIIAKLAAL